MEENSICTISNYNHNHDLTITAPSEGEPTYYAHSLMNKMNEIEKEELFGVRYKHRNSTDDCRKGDGELDPSTGNKKPEKPKQLGEPSLFDKLKDWIDDNKDLLKNSFSLEPKRFWYAV